MLNWMNASLRVAGNDCSLLERRTVNDYISHDAIRFIVRLDVETRYSSSYHIVFDVYGDRRATTALLGRFPVLLCELGTAFFDEDLSCRWDRCADLKHESGTARFVASCRREVPDSGLTLMPCGRD